MPSLILFNIYLEEAVIITSKLLEMIIRGYLLAFTDYMLIMINSKVVMKNPQDKSTIIEVIEQWVKSFKDPRSTLVRILRVIICSSSRQDNYAIEEEL